MTKKRKIIILIFSFVLAAALMVISGFLIYCIPRTVDLSVDTKNQEVISMGKYSLLFNSDDGLFSISKDSNLLFCNAYSEYKLNNNIVTSKDYDEYEITETEEGGKKTVEVSMRKNGLPVLVQSFEFYNNEDYFLTYISISDKTEIKTNYIAPIVISDGSLQNGDPVFKKILEVPFDNDGWVEFKVKELFQSTVSYEVGALFTPDSGSGFIFGSTRHDHWKSALSTDGSFGKIQSLRLYCGATDPRTGDEPHGELSGNEIKSPEMFVGCFDNWKDGMKAFTDANLAQQPKRKSVSSEVPFGWNSWGSVQDKLNYETAINISDYISKSFQPSWQQKDEPVYVNLDSWWDMLDDGQLADFVEHCHENGQKAGIYTAPFIQWYSDEEMDEHFVPGTNDTVTYQDIRLKKSDGTYYGNEVDGCIPLDVTNPDTKKHVEAQINRFKAAGFDYIKVDFLVHASFEGDYYDENIHTGIEAYNYAMTYLNELIGDDVFINLAMSPTFPYHYANGRRIACDAFYSIKESEYTLNALTYGFWEQGLYDFPDPDHLVIWGKDGKARENEARCRLTLGAIAGTSFLTGDNFIEPANDEQTAQNRFSSMLCNEDVIRVAKIGKAFNPIISNDCPKAANIYTLEDGEKIYIAVFNFSLMPETFNIPLDIGGEYKVKELWSGEESTAKSELKYRVNKQDAVLLELQKMQ